LSPDPYKNKFLTALKTKRGYPIENRKRLPLLRQPLSLVAGVDEISNFKLLLDIKEIVEFLSK